MLDVTNREGRRAFAERLAQWQEKALREAKLATEWAVPNETYEAAARRLYDVAGEPITRCRNCSTISWRSPRVSAPQAPSMGLPRRC